MRWRNQRNLYGSQNCLSPRYVIRNSLGVSRNDLMDFHAGSGRTRPRRSSAERKPATSDLPQARTMTHRSHWRSMRFHCPICFLRFFYVCDL